MVMVKCGLCFPAKGTLKEVPLEGVHVQARLFDTIAQVTLVQNYVNLSEKPIETLYMFPLDSEAAVCDFQAEISGQVVVASVKEKQAARREYEQAKAQGDAAFLLEEIRGDIFQVSVGAIPAYTRVNVMISYVVELKVLEDGSTRFLLPTTVAPRYTPRSELASHIAYTTPWFSLFPDHVQWQNFFEAGRGLRSLRDESSSVARPRRLEMPYALSLCVDVSASSRITRVTAAAHAVDAWATTQDGKSARVVLVEDAALAGDLSLRIYQEHAHQPRAALEINPANKSAVAMVTMVPAVSFGELKVEVVFVVDRSGSMSGSKIQTVSRALRLFLRALPADCFFNLVSFGSTFSSLFPASVRYDDQSLDQATRYLDQLSANLGGTELVAPLTAVFSNPHPANYARQVFVITDGEVSNTAQVIRVVQRFCQPDGNCAREPHARCFAVGIGSEVSHELVQGLARAGNGTAHVLVDGESLEPRVMAQLREALQPAIEDINFEWGAPTEWPIADIAEMLSIPTSSSCKSVTEVPPNTSGGFGSFFGHGSPAAAAAPSIDPVHRNRVPAQVPYPAPPIFSGQRFVAFAFFKASQLPKSVSLTAKSPDGPLKLTLDFELHEGNVVHRLGARKLIRDLEEARSALHRSGVLWQPSPVQERSLIVALGTKFTLASKFTSFIAIEPRWRCLPDRRESVATFGLSHQRNYSFGRQISDSLLELTTQGNQLSSVNLRTAGASHSSGCCGSSNFNYSPPSVLQTRRPASVATSSSTTATAPTTPTSSASSKQGTPVPQTKLKLGDQAVASNLLSKLALLQRSDGSFQLQEELSSAILVTPLSRLSAAKPVGVLDNHWATALAIAFVHEKLATIRDHWELIFAKAQQWLSQESKQASQLIAQATDLIRASATT